MSQMVLVVALGLLLASCSASDEELASEAVDQYVEALRSMDRTAYTAAVGDDAAQHFDVEVECLDWNSVEFEMTPDLEVGAFYTVQFIDSSGTTMERPVQHGGTFWQVETFDSCGSTAGATSTS